MKLKSFPPRPSARPQPRGRRARGLASACPPRPPRRLSPWSGAAPAALRASTPARAAPSAGRSAMGTARRASRARAAAEHSAGRSCRSSGRMPGRGEQRCPRGSCGAGGGLAEPPRPSGKQRGSGAARPWDYSSRHAPRRRWGGRTALPRRALRGGGVRRGRPSRRVAGPGTGVSRFERSFHSVS